MKEQEYRHHAKQAREMAATMRTDDDRRFWLNLATQLEQLAQQAAAALARPTGGGMDRPVGLSRVVHPTMSKVSKGRHDRSPR
jgi:hypothetical protein